LRKLKRYKNVLLKFFLDSVVIHSAATKVALVYRRARGDMIEVFKIVHGYCADVAK